MPAASKTKASKLIEKLNALLHQKERNEFTLRKFRKEAENLRSSDAFSAYLLLGMLASLDNDVDKLRKNHLAALNLRPDDPDANFNYSMSLINLCFYSEARVLAEKAYQGSRGNLKYLSFLIEICLKSGRIREARKWLHKFEELKPEVEIENKRIIQEAFGLLSEAHVSDDEVDEVLEMSSSVLRHNKIAPNIINIGTLSDEYSYWLQYLFEVEETPENIADLNFDVAMRLAESIIPAKVTNAVIATFTSAVS